MHKRLGSIAVILVLTLLSYILFHRDTVPIHSLLEQYGLVDSYPHITAKDHIRGSKNPQYILVEYGDYDCPYCKQFHPIVKEWVSTSTIVPVAWVFRYFPLAAHEFAMGKAIAAECAAQSEGEEAFWTFTDRMYSEPAPKFSTCDAPKVRDRVLRDVASGNFFGIGGTPMSFLINTHTKRAVAIPGVVSLKQLFILMEKTK